MGEVAGRSAEGGEDRSYLVKLERAPMKARSRPRLLGVAFFAQTRDTHGGGYEGADLFHDLAELFKDPHPVAPADEPAGEPFGTVHPAFCNFISFDPEIPKGKRAVIEIEGNEQATDPKYGAIDVFVTPDWTPGPGGTKPPGEPRTTFGGNGGCWVRGPGRLTVHVRTDLVQAPWIKVRIEAMP